MLEWLKQKLKKQFFVIAPFMLGGCASQIFPPFNGNIWGVISFVLFLNHDDAMPKL